MLALCVLPRGTSETHTLGKQLSYLGARHKNVYMCEIEGTKEKQSIPSMLSMCATNAR